MLRENTGNSQVFVYMMGPDLCDPLEELGGHSWCKDYRKGIL